MTQKILFDQITGDSIQIGDTLITGNRVTRNDGPVAGVNADIYANTSLLPTTNLQSGVFAYVTETNTLYYSNGSGWFKIALINETPTITLDKDLIELTSDISNATFSYTVDDPEEFPVTISVTDDFGGLANTVLYESNNTIEVNNLSITETNDYQVTVSASDGINIATASIPISYNSLPAGMATDVAIDNLVGLWNFSTANPTTDLVGGYTGTLNSGAVVETHSTVGAMRTNGSSSRGLSITDSNFFNGGFTNNQATVMFIVSWDDTKVMFLTGSHIGYLGAASSTNSFYHSGISFADIYMYYNNSLTGSLQTPYGGRDANRYTVVFCRFTSSTNLQNHSSIMAPASYGAGWHWDGYFKEIGFYNKHLTVSEMTLIGRDYNTVYGSGVMN